MVIIYAVCFIIIILALVFGVGRYLKEMFWDIQAMRFLIPAIILLVAVDLLYFTDPGEELLEKIRLRVGPILVQFGLKKPPVEPLNAETDEPTTDKAKNPQQKRFKPKK